MVAKIPRRNAWATSGEALGSCQGLIQERISRHALPEAALGAASGADDEKIHAQDKSLPFRAFLSFSGPTQKAYHRPSYLLG